MQSTLKRIARSALVTFLFCFSAEGGVGRYGLLAGANMANISSQPDDAFTARTGSLIGGFYEFLVSPFVGLGSDFLIASKGGKRGTDSVTLKITYFEAPLLVKFHFGSNRFGFFIFGGPSVGFVLSSSGETSAGADVVITSLYLNEMGVQFGGGAELPLTETLGVVFSARYSLGLSDISQAANNYKNNGIYLLAGLTFRMEDEDRFTETEARAKEYLNERYQKNSDR